MVIHKQSSKKKTKYLNLGIIHIKGSLALNITLQLDLICGSDKNVMDSRSQSGPWLVVTKIHITWEFYEKVSDCDCKRGDTISLEMFNINMWYIFLWHTIIFLIPP